MQEKSIRSAGIADPGGIDAAPSSVIIGYTAPLSGRPGDEISVMIHCEQQYKASVVMLNDCPVSGHDGSFASQTDLDLGGTRPAIVQETQFGSYVAVPHHAAMEADSWTFSMWMMPTRCESTHEQVILSKRDSSTGVGIRLLVGTARRLVLDIALAPAGDGQTTRLELPALLEDGYWYRVAVSHSAAARRVTLGIQPMSPWLAAGFAEAQLPAPASLGHGWLYFGAAEHMTRPGGRRQMSGHYNGKLEEITLYRGELDLSTALGDGVTARDDVVARWDFSLQQYSNVVVDRGEHDMHGQAYGLPTRAAAGHDWTGKPQDLRGIATRRAMHFHEDDLEDAGWTPAFRFTIPRHWPSGVYAVKLTSPDDCDYVPFIVRPPEDTQARVAVVLPTFTYTAYANIHTDVTDGTMDAALAGRPPRLCREESIIQRHYQDLLGLSLYDPHTDGTGTVYSTRLRPIMHMRPHYSHWKTGLPRGFPADLALLGWLRRNGTACDVLTDDSVAFDGENLLNRYQVVMTGDHPEYVTDTMWARFSDFVASGGRLMYLGGNGFYWVTSADPRRAHMIEVRRGHGGSGGSPNSLPGEELHSLTGEQGGIWRFRGRPPQALLGVGTTAAGWVTASPYARADVESATGKAVFDGVGETLIGTSGGFPGVAGDEIDRADRQLGTPPQTEVLASSAGMMDEHYWGTNEDYQPYANAGAADRGDANVRADMTLTWNHNCGAVFSVGSVAWILGLRRAHADPAVGQITHNVLRLFLDPPHPSSRRTPPPL